MSDHNHLTRDIKPPGVCPGCDVYHRSQQEGHRAEPANGGESVSAAEISAAQRVTLARDLEAAWYGGYARDLAAADDSDVAQVAYEIADSLDFTGPGGGDELVNLARRLRDWADRYDDLDPRNAGVTRKRGEET